MALTDTQRYTNYIHLIKTIEFLDKQGRITEDWMEDQKKQILRYRALIPNFGALNDDLIEHEFRFKCEETEEITRYLCDSIRLRGTFDVQVYYAMVANMKYICDEVFNEDELAQCMELLTF